MDGARWINRWADRAGQVKLSRLLLIIVFFSELFTLLSNTVLSLIWWGRISRDLLLIGCIDALFVSLLVGAIVIYLLRHTAQLTFGQRL